MLNSIKNYFKIKEIKRKIRNKKICYLTGAGISVNSGIKPFRGKDGIYTKIPDLIYKLRPDSFDSDPDFLYNFHENFRKELISKEPNNIHYLIKETASYIITQNIDDLHEKSGSEHVIHVHGAVNEYKCRSCLKDFKGSFKQDDNCPACGVKQLRHNVVLFKENLINQKEASKALFVSSVLICVGTSGSVYPVALYPKNFVGYKICINKELPENYHMFDEVLIGDTEKILERLF